MSLTVIIPCKNEEKNIKKILDNLNLLIKKNYNIEVKIIDDHSQDNSVSYIKEQRYKNLYIIKNKNRGLGSAIQTGILNSKKKYFTIMMADSSDHIEDLKKYYHLSLKNKFDGIFGSRFIKGSKIRNYPLLKLILNRVFNFFIKFFFKFDFNDFTNAFKCYNTKKIKKLLPLDSYSFNIFFELSIKAFIYNYKIKIIPITWNNNRIDISHFKIKELSFHYIFTFFRCYYIKKFNKNFII